MGKSASGFAEPDANPRPDSKLRSRLRRTVLSTERRGRADQLSVARVKKQRGFSARVAQQNERAFGDPPILDGHEPSDRRKLDQCLCADDGPRHGV